MENMKLSQQIISEKKYKTVNEYIELAERLGLSLSVADLQEIDRVLKAEGEKCKEKN